MQKPWILPLVILALLIAAWAFRWDYGASKTYDSGVIKWKVDRWTSQDWREVYSVKEGQFDVPGGTGSVQTNQPYVNSCWDTRNAWTLRWGIITAAVFVWFAYAVWLGPWLLKRKGGD